MSKPTAASHQVRFAFMFISRGWGFRHKAGFSAAIVFVIKLVFQQLSHLHLIQERLSVQPIEM
jgi:hypothetical protein